MQITSPLAVEDCMDFIPGEGIELHFLLGVKKTVAFLGAHPPLFREK